MSSSSSSSYSGGTYDGSSSSSFYSDIFQHGYEEFPLDENTLEDEIIMSLMKEEMLNFKKRRTSKQRTVDYWSTSWGQLITNPATMDLTTTEGKLFRRRFRVPFPVFQKVLVPLCKEKNIFQMKKTSYQNEVQSRNCGRAYPTHICVCCHTLQSWPCTSLQRSISSERHLLPT